MNGINKSITLKSYLEQIKKAIATNISNDLWIEAEIASLDKKSGHCYIELVELNQEGKEVAKVRAVIWKTNFDKLNNKFHTVTGNYLQKNIKLKVKVNAVFSEIYSLSLNIVDIDPKFTLGDIEVKKQQILDILKAEGKINKNKLIPVPVFFTKVAVISSKEAAGLQDFNKEANILSKLSLCTFDYYYCSVQGIDTEHSVIECLKQVYRLQQSEQKYDAVAIIRGGGSTMDLNWFNNYKIANAVCQMNLPVFIGIGHEKDKTILDIVSNKSFDTPSKAILYIENVICDKINRVNLSLKQVIKSSDNFIELINKNLIGQTKLIAELANNNLIKSDNSLDNEFESIFNKATFKIINQEHSLHQCSNIIFQYSESYLLKAMNDTNIRIKTITEHASIAIKDVNYRAEQIYCRSLNFTEGVLINESRNLDLFLSNIVNSSEKIATSYLSLINSTAEKIIHNSENLVNQYSQNLEYTIKLTLNNSIQPQLERGFTLPLSENKVIKSSKEALEIKQFNLKFKDSTINVTIL
jgi:exodeoxyribonuclease VII large subunit